MMENLRPFAVIYAIVELGFVLAFTAMFFDRGHGTGVEKIVRQPKTVHRPHRL